MHNRDVIFQFGKWSSCTDLVVLQVMYPDARLCNRKCLPRGVTLQPAEINNITDLHQIKIILALKLQCT